jgi:hypothetical protein
MERADFSGVFSEIFDEGVNLAKILMRQDEVKIPDDAFGKARESLSEDVYEALVEWGPATVRPPLVANDLFPTSPHIQAIWGLPLQSQTYQAHPLS